MPNTHRPAYAAQSEPSIETRQVSTPAELDPNALITDDDNQSQIVNSPQVGEMDPWRDLGHGGIIRLIDIVDDVELAELKKEVLECVEPRFRGIPFMDDEELLAGLLRMRVQGQDPRFPVKRTKNAQLIYDGKNAELKRRIIQRKWPELALVLHYDDTTDDGDTATLDRAFDGRIGRGSLGKSDRAFQAVEAYLTQKENRKAIKAAGGKLKSQQQIAAEKGVSATYVEDLLRVRKKSKKLYALVGERKIKVRSAAEIADDEDENTWAGLLKVFEGCSHLTDDEARRLLGEYRAAKASRNKRGRAGTADDPPAVADDAVTVFEEEAEAERTGRPNGADAPDEGEETADVAAANADRSDTGDAVPPPTPTNPPAANAASRDGAIDDPPAQEAGTDDAPADDLGVFVESLTALGHLQELLRTYPATPALIEALETTLKSARESCSE